MAALDAASAGAEAGLTAVLATDAAADAGGAGSAVCKADGGEVSALADAGGDGSGSGAFTAMTIVCGLAVTGDSDPARYFRPKLATAITETAANSNTLRFEGLDFRASATKVGGETGSNACG